MDNVPDKIEAASKIKKLIEKRSVRIGALLLLLTLAVGFLLGVIKVPGNPLPVFQKKVQVQIKTEYKNPFAKETQYINPFDEYKNPFVVAK